MFECAETYASMARDHVKEASCMLSNYDHLIRGGDGETALDIGCGPGSVTVESLGKFRKWRKVIGVDYNQEMVDFANKQNPDTNQFEFKMVNFNQPLSGDFANNKFDKIFSFFALQWMNNRSSKYPFCITADKSPTHRTVAKNIYDLLKAKGQAFLLIVAHSKIYEVWDKLALSPEWQRHLMIAKPLNELVYEERPEEMFLSPLREVGFAISKSEVLERKNIFSALENTNESKIEKLKTVDPFLKLIPESYRERYLQDLFRRVMSDIGPNGATDYTAHVVLAQKN